MTVAHSLPSVAMIRALDAMIAVRGQPTRLSLDNGSELRSRAFDARVADRGIERCFIQPGNPIQDCHIESFNGRVRDECLNVHGSGRLPTPISTWNGGGAATTRTGPTNSISP